MATAEEPTPLGPGYWRDRAREAWALAARLHDLEAKSTMVSITNGYNRLAERAAKLDAGHTAAADLSPPTERSRHWRGWQRRR
jgi:hypothetical protein